MYTYSHSEIRLKTFGLCLSTPLVQRGGRPMAGFPLSWQKSPARKFDAREIPRDTSSVLTIEQILRETCSLVHRY